MQKFILTVVSATICSLSIVGSIATAGFAQPQTKPTTVTPALKSAPAQTNTPTVVDILQLSKEQKTKLIKLQQNTKQTMVAVLTPKQKDQLRIAMQQGKPPTLALTTEQEVQLKAIQTSALAEQEAILTTKQKQKLQQMRDQSTPQP